MYLFFLLKFLGFFLADVKIFKRECVESVNDLHVTRMWISNE